jgi:hypothetical protein
MSFDLSAIERALAALAAEGRAARFMCAGRGAVRVGALSAVASTRAGEFYEGDEANVEGYVLAPAATRLLVGVTQGNEKGTNTAVAGAIALLALARAAEDGTSAAKALSGASAEIADLAKRKTRVNRVFGAAAVGAVRDLTGIGTSAIALDLGDGGATIAHLGECSAFRVRDGEARCVAAPHTLARLAERTGDAELRARIAEDPWMGEVVCAVLGGTAEAELSAIHVRPGDAFVVTSARAAHLAPSRIAEAVVPDAAATLERLVAAVADTHEHIGVTVIVVRMD